MHKEFMFFCVRLSHVHEGAFFVPYVIFFVCCGIPVFFLETAMGQFTSEGGITCWRKICPLFEGERPLFTSRALGIEPGKKSLGQPTSHPYPSCAGIGYATQVIEAHLNVYYIVILSWAIFYLFNCFTTELPWAGCGHYWNTGKEVKSVLCSCFTPQTTTLIPLRI